ncbi:gamma-glutamyltransferase family protein [Rubrivivax gelatinosus]|uniref:Gamma-glutamyltransferase n=1 Tax=Rubrivivax gelatinosus TaxID=28068 RepID=A0ABS1DX12_RUBGE|nr:gamma-glutamyltransferase family protein [Rubrivivax gelatinosus]MBK1713297.1 gamma-glutamyltransferase [Rubrivivax gelatinosus]
MDFATPDYFDWNAGYPSRRLPVFARNLVATSHPLAAQAGLRMLAAGGNAVDAAVAAAAAMTIVEPCSNGLGSDAFCILWDGQRLHGLNASGRAPQAWTPEYFRRRHGADARTPPVRGWDAVTVPGAVSAWVALAERFGRLPLAQLLEPAAEIAERGYAVPVVVGEKWAAAAGVQSLVSQPGFAETFLPRGRAPRVGERFTLPGAARALRAIAATRGQAFYGGEIAETLVRQAQAQGGAQTLADFSGYAPEWVEPLAMDYGGATLHEIPPNGQGIAALIALGILRHAGLDEHPADSVAAQHLQIEAMKLAFADVYRFVAEPQAMGLTAADLLAPGYLAERAKLIDPRRAQDHGAGNPVKGGTIYLTAADESGMMVSFIQSNYMGFGSGVVVPEWGLSLQNRGHGFSLDAASANLVAPGKRPFHTIIPGFVTAAGRPLMSFGVMGANMQPQGHLQTYLRMVEWNQNPQAACDAPRWRFNAGLEINVEAAMDARLVQGLAALGHRIEVIQDSYQDFGAGQFIWRLGEPAVEGYAAASDPRRDGQAAGF